MGIVTGAPWLWEGGPVFGSMRPTGFRGPKANVSFPPLSHLLNVKTSYKFSLNRSSAVDATPSSESPRINLGLGDISRHLCRERRFPVRVDSCNSIIIGIPTHHTAVTVVCCGCWGKHITASRHTRTGSPIDPVGSRPRNRVPSNVIPVV